MRPLLEAYSLVYAVAPQKPQTRLHRISLLLEKAPGWVTLVSIHIGGNVIKDQNYQIVLVGYLLQIFGVLQQKIRPLDEINLTVSLYEVVPDRLDVVNNHKLDPFILYSLCQVYENFIVVLEGLTMRKDNVLSNLLLRNLIFVLHQEKFFNFVKPFLVKRLTSHQIKRLAF